MPLGRLPQTTQLLDVQGACGLSEEAARQPARGSQHMPTTAARRARVYGTRPGPTRTDPFTLTAASEPNRLAEDRPGGGVGTRLSSRKNHAMGEGGGGGRAAGRGRLGRRRQGANREVQQR